MADIEQLVQKSSHLLCLNFEIFMELDLPPRRNIIEPWLPSPGLSMIYAPPGIGKTFLALSIANAVSTGSDFLCWSIPHPQGVLYLDGEMPAASMQERLRLLTYKDAHKPRANFRILSRDLNPITGLNLSNPDHQELIEPFIDDINLIIVDNISTLCRGKENDAESWEPVQEWCLRMRAMGKSVLFIHHTSKAGKQRGTSKKEDILDTIISLRAPQDAKQNQGATFELHFEKSRGFTGEAAEPILCGLNATEHVWEFQRISGLSPKFNAVNDLMNKGYTQAEVARQLNVNRSTVSRKVAKSNN